MVKTPGGREQAARIYAQAGPTYHAMTRQAVEATVRR
jgi:hypothetical protein